MVPTNSAMEKAVGESTEKDEKAQEQVEPSAEAPEGAEGELNYEKVCSSCGARYYWDARFCNQCGQSLDEVATEGKDPLLGQVIAGNFKILELIGVGAMGKVYKAEQMSLAKEVSIKILHQYLLRDENLVKRFHREARASSQLRHPNSISIIDFGQAENGALFIAMEFLRGRNLAQVIKDEYPLAAKRIISIMTQACSALEEAHEKKIIHRDLKPENIMVEDLRDRKDFVKVLDFGIAKVQDGGRQETDTALTMAGVVCGTPEYMSPEQARGETLDARSDLYAMGVILYQLLAGEIPFEADSAIGVVTKHLIEMPVPPCERRPDLAIPAVLERVCLRALSKRKEERQDSALEMKQELEEAQAYLDQQERGPVSMPIPIEAALSPSLLDRMGPEERSRGRGLGVAVLLIALTLLGGGAFAAWHYWDRLPFHEEPPVTVQPLPQPQAPPAVVPVVTVKPREPEVVPERVVQIPPPEKVEPPEPQEPKVVPKAPAPEKDPPPKGKVAGTKGKADKGLSANDYFKQGEELFMQGRFNDAIAKYKLAIQRNGRLAKAYRKIGMAYTRMGQPKKSVKFYKKYIKLAPNDPNLPYIRAIVNSHGG